MTNREESLHVNSTPHANLENLSAGAVSHLTLHERAAAAVQRYTELPIVAEVLTRLQSELPKDLRYHNFEHTVDVMHEAAALALKDGLAERDVELLVIAAAFHDLGFVERRELNEPIGADAALNAMVRHGYGAEEAAAVATAIWDTQLRPAPAAKTLEQQIRGRLSGYLCDADLSNFGKAHSFVKTVRVWEEITGKEVESAKDFKSEAGEKFLAGVIRLVDHHRWHTPAALELYEENKKENLGKLVRFLTVITGGQVESLERVWNELMG